MKKYTPLRRCLLATGLLFATGVQAQPTTYTFSPVNQHDISLTAAYWNPIIQYVFEKSGIQLKLRSAALRPTPPAMCWPRR